MCTSKTLVDGIHSDDTTPLLRSSDPVEGAKAWDTARDIFVMQPMLCLRTGLDIVLSFFNVYKTCIFIYNPMTYSYFVAHRSISDSPAVRRAPGGTGVDRAMQVDIRRR